MTDRADRTVQTTVQDRSTLAGNALSWPQWQRDVLRVLRTELQELTYPLRLDDVDWPSWQVLYDQGRTPHSAVDRALERDL